MTIEIHRNIADPINDPGIRSWQHIKVDLIDPTRRLHIMSGIAVPGFEVNDQDQTYRGDCEVYLEVTLNKFVQAVCEVGLASISNGESAFTYALEDAWVEPRWARGGELVLTVPMAAMGENSGLNRFGFQIVALEEKHPSGVFGHIRWSRDIFDASRIKDANKILTVTANIIQRVTPATGFSYDQPVPLGGNGILGGIFREGEDFAVRYQFDHLPLNAPINFSWTLAPDFPQDCIVGETPPRTPLFLTLTHTTESDVDFRIRRNVVR